MRLASLALVQLLAQRRTALCSTRSAIAANEAVVTIPPLESGAYDRAALSKIVQPVLLAEIERQVAEVDAELVDLGVEVPRPADTPPPLGPSGAGANTGGKGPKAG